MYRERAQAISAGEDAASVWEHFHRAKDDLFAHHPQSALDEGEDEEYSKQAGTINQHGLLLSGNIAYLLHSAIQLKSGLLGSVED